MTYREGTPEYFMSIALELARLAAEKGEVPVGAVVVRDDKIIGSGFNMREANSSACAHAELLAIEQACKSVGSWRLADCDIYVTLEPCPMCAGACINSRLRRVYYGADDEKAGSLYSVQAMFHMPYNHHPQVVRGVLKEQCAKVLSDFFSALR